MQHSVHLHPERLRVHAAEAADLAAGVRSVLSDRPRGGSPDLDHVATTLRRAAQELGELEAVLLAAADTAERADAEAAGALRGAGPS